jgi:SAM-dependent methyltransferase
LLTKAPDLFLSQEPFKPSQQDRPAIAGYRLVSTSPLVSCWIAQQHACPTIIEHSERWHEIRHRGVSAHNVYLSPYSSAERRAMLNELASAISGTTAVVVTGDFNLAPRPEDGLYGDQPSTFTKPSERRAFEELLGAADLVDATCPSPGENLAFTFERMQQGRHSCFRCDLALISSHFAGSAGVFYDHSVRAMPDAFTDHSALIVDVETDGMEALASDQVVTGTRGVERAARRNAVGPAVTASASHKTAIKRQNPSQIARRLDEQGVLSSLGVRSILDFGCGYGADVEFYRSKGYNTDGFDIEPRFGWTRRNERLHDLVTLVFVVNVLPTSEDRLSAVRDAARHVRPGGYLLIAARSESAISAEARKGNWAPFNDGWISARQKGTFQKGIALEELAWCADEIGFRIAECSLRLSSDVSWLLCRRPR